MKKLLLSLAAIAILAVSANASVEGAYKFISSKMSKEKTVKPVLYEVDAVGSEELQAVQADNSQAEKVLLNLNSLLNSK